MIINRFRVNYISTMKYKINFRQKFLHEELTQAECIAIRA